MWLLKILPFIAFLVGCASQPEKVADTRWPQVIINLPKEQLREAIVAAMASEGTSVEDSSESLIQARSPDPRAGVAKAFFGCASCADPYIKTTVVLSAVTGGTQIVIQYWRMIPKTNGSEQRMEIEGAADFNQVQQMLWTLRDQVTGGHTYSGPGDPAYDGPGGDAYAGPGGPCYGGPGGPCYAGPDVGAYSGRSWGGGCPMVCR